MRGTVDDGQSRVHEHLSQQLDVALVFPPEGAALLPFKGLDGLAGARQQHGRQRRGEYEAGSVTTHRVHQGVGTGDVASNTAKRLAWKNKDNVKRAVIKKIKLKQVD